MEKVLLSTKTHPIETELTDKQPEGRLPYKTMKIKKNYDLKNKKCLKCQKKFLNGNLKKSKVIQCNGCGGFVHEKSTTGCKVNLSRGNLQFYCAPCGEFAGTVREDANNINIAEFEIQENGAEDILEVEVEDDVGQAVPEDVVAAQEDEEDIVVEIQAHGAEDTLEDALAPDVPEEEENNDIVAAQEEEEDVVVEIQENGAEGIIEVEDAVAQAVPEEEENNDSDVVAAQEEEEEIVVELQRETNHQIVEEAENPNPAAEFKVSHSKEEQSWMSR